jgi:hypothetical protein
MASQAELTAVANALVKECNAAIGQLQGWESMMVKQYLTPDKIAAGAGAAAKTAIDALDAVRAAEKPA